MEQTPFDGCVFSVKHKSPGGEDINLTWNGWSRRAFTEAELAPALADLKAIPLHRFKDNFLRFNVTPGDVEKPSASALVQPSAPMGWRQVAALVWVTGSGLIIFAGLGAYLRTMRRLRRGSIPVAPAAAVEERILSKLTGWSPKAERSPLVRGAVSAIG